MTKFVTELSSVKMVRMNSTVLDRNRKLTRILNQVKCVSQYYNLYTCSRAGGYTSQSPEGCLGCGDGTTCEPCSDDQFDCGNGQCIPADRQCDGIRDCDNMEDEDTCPCHQDQFTCRDGGCVPLDYVCDKRYDCQDWSDEMSCPCKEDEFMCDGGQCISASKKCNQILDCRYLISKWAFQMQLSK